MTDGKQPLDVEQAVRERYSACARQPEPSLCCPVDYDPERLAAIPEEVVERDFGCGDPTRWVRRGDTVLDLGCGAGKTCYLAAQWVGPTGRVIGIDMNEAMLAVARRNREAFAARTGLTNLDFRRARIQDLKAEVADRSVDCIVSNCVLNLVRREDRLALFAEMYRVLRDGGRAAISDVVADRAVPMDLQRDPELWSGCISGAFPQDRFLDAFAEAGFRDVSIAARADEPFRVVEGIVFRSVTVTARKGPVPTGGPPVAATSCC